MRLSKSIRFILALLPVCVCGAAIFFFALPMLQAPRVVFIEPADDARDILPTSSITITFSAPMNQEVTQNAIRISPHVNGIWNWRDNNQTLIFSPRDTLPLSKTLTIEVSQAARSFLQQPLAQAARARLTTLAYPHVVTSTPALDAQFIYVPNRVTLTFDRALNAESVRANFTITPTLANATLRIDANTITLDGFFQPRTQYHITIRADAMDAAYAIPLERDFVWTFTTAAQYPNLSILHRGRVLEFPAQTEISIPLQFTNVSRLDVAVYPLTQSEFDANAAAPFETWYAFQPTTAPLWQQRLATNAALDAYTTRTLPLDALPAGNYYLAITSPEGVSDVKLVRVD
jgi:methionine-rich copper-binding protein CopC